MTCNRGRVPKGNPFVLSRRKSPRQNNRLAYNFSVIDSLRTSFCSRDFSLVTVKETVELSKNINSIKAFCLGKKIDDLSGEV